MIQNVKRILCPMDFSEFSMQAMKGAWELAKDVGAELHLLHVVVPERNFVPSFLAYNAEKEREIAREAGLVQEAEEELARIRKDHLQNSPKAVTSVVTGSPPVKIVEYVEQNGIDLILVSTHGRTGVNRMLIGSVTEKVVRSAPCSVLVLRGAG